MKRKVKYSKIASRFLDRIGGRDKATIKSKINQYAENPESLKNNVKKLKGSNWYRLRIGNYRAIFSETLEILHIERVGTRGDVYKNLK